MSASTNHPIPFKGATEAEALSRARRYHGYGKGELRYWKSRYQRRVRRVAKAEAEREARSE
jgi:hypothetical protein